MQAIFLVAGFIVFIDQLSKYLAVHFLSSAGSHPVIPGIFHLSYVENTGIAFGFFHSYPQLWLVIISLSVAGLAVGSWFFKNKSLIQRIAYGFILGGAIGNWIDRLRVHYVIDFLDFRVWPVFNIADSFITIGVAIFIWFALKGE